MSTLTPLKFILTRLLAVAERLWTVGLTFWESYFLIITSALVLAFWLKWQLLHFIVISLAIAFYAISPRDGCRLIVAKWRSRPFSQKPQTAT